MEIQRLRVVLRDQDLSDLARKHLLKEVAVEELELRLEVEGLRVKGVYQMFVPVSFEVLWELGVEGGKATARLASFRTMGMPANVLKSLIMNVIADAAKKEQWLQVRGDTVLADIDGLLKKRGFDAHTHLSAIRCEAGKMIVEAGPQTA